MEVWAESLSYRSRPIGRLRVGQRSAYKRAGVLDQCSGAANRLGCDLEQGLEDVGS